MSDTVTIALVGIAGYGSFYVDSILDESEGKDVRCVAAIDHRPERCERLAELREQGAAVFPDLDEFYRKSFADLVIISAPIHLHRQFTCRALEGGSSVLCEKPLAGSVQDALQMAEAEEEAKGFVAIGYQWSFSDAVQELKKDIMAGKFGRPLRLKTLVLAPRRKGYYERNDWAGALRAPDGTWVLDSPINNAMAHYLHNMFYILGNTRETSAVPVDVQAELYRANGIENFDTAAIRCRVKGGAEILLYASHAVGSMLGPVLRFEFEKGVVSLTAPDPTALRGQFHDGHMREYGQTRKIWDSVRAVRTGEQVACGIKAAMSQTLCVNGAQDSMPGIVTFPRKLIKGDDPGGDSLVRVEGLETALMQCCERAIMPSENGGQPWARAGKVVDLKGYSHFPAAR